jgi:tellurite resistance protein TehA-like permease
VPFRFSGIDTIGTIFFIFNIVLFVVNVACITTRFVLYPETFKASLLHPTESLFMPAAVVSFGTILINISQYGLHNVGIWLNTAVMTLFWVDVVLAFFSSTLTYLLV